MPFLTFRRAIAAQAPVDQTAESPGVEEAWKTLTLTIEMIKHAETKAATALAASGVLGGILYTLTTRLTETDLVVQLATAVCAVFVLGAAFGAGMALRPRFGKPGQAPSLLYYDHIGQRYGSDPVGYVDAFMKLVCDRPALARSIAAQIWVNAGIARRKYRWGNVAILSLLAATGTIAVAAIAASRVDG